MVVVNTHANKHHVGALLPSVSTPSRPLPALCTFIHPKRRIETRRRIQCAASKDETRTEGSTALIRKVLKQYEREGKVEESQRLRKLFELERAAELQDEKWGLFDWSRYQRQWDVPWGPGTTAAGVALWAGSFVLTGAVLVPFLALSLHIPGLGSGSPEDKAVFALFNQVLTTATGLGVVWLVTRSHPLPPDMFVYNPSAPFSKPRGWLAWALAGLASAPLVVAAVAAVTSLFVEEVAGRGTVDAVAGIIDLSPTSYVALLTVTSVLAPLLEETVFRGFLLTSLTKYMSTPAAVLISSVLFGAAHLSAKDFPQLTALGIVMGLAYIRSGNLLAPMFIHGMWNGSVLTILFLLSASGIDLQEFLSATLPHL